MKRFYEKPTMHWNSIRSQRAIADVCWAYANNKQPFYYNTYGTGYAELYAVSGGCTRDVVFGITYMPESMSAEDRARADADMQRVIAEIRATMPNKPNNYKGSPFVAGPDSSWS